MLMFQDAYLHTRNAPKMRWPVGQIIILSAAAMVGSFSVVLSHPLDGAALNADCDIQRSLAVENVGH